MALFPKNGMMTLVGSSPRFDLAESLGPDLHLRDVPGLHDIALGYGSAAGDPRLRAAIAKRHGVDADDVVVTAGGMHALFLIAFILCQPGSEAVTTAPLFPFARTTLAAVGADIRTVTVDFAHRYQLDPGKLGDALTQHTKLVSLASPQNPSGVAIAAETISVVLDAMRAKCPQAYLLVDETYREAAYDGDTIAASVVGLDTKVISVSSFSKCHGAPGLRIGWAITRDCDLREQLLVGKFSTVISCSVVDEALALGVLELSRQKRREQFAVGRDQVAAWVQHNTRLIDWVRPDAGAICCVRLRPDAFDDAAVSRFYAQLAVQQVRVAEGAWFGDETRVFRLGFGLLDPPALDAALASVSMALERAIGA